MTTRSHRSFRLPPPIGRAAATLVAAALVVGGSIGAIPAVAAPDDGGESAPGPTTTVPDPPSSTTTSTTTTTTTTTSTTTTTTTVAPTTTLDETPELPPNPAPEPTGPTTVAPTTTAAPTALNITVYPEQIAHILATIRYMESRGIYTLPPNRGNASGAYQFIESTWDGYGGYQHAYQAPPAVQDERAAADVQMFLDRFDNDLSMVPVMWYYPAAVRDPLLMDIIPVPSAGNVLTVREYQARWLNIWAFISGQPIPPVLTAEQIARQSGMPPVVPEPVGGIPSISYPVLGPSRAAVPECDDAEQIEVADADGSAGDDRDDRPTLSDVEAAGLCTEQAPGVVFGVKLQPILAVADGIVTDVQNEDGEPITVTVTDESGMSYVYSGFNDDNPGTNDGAAPDHLRLSGLAEIGRTVRAGQVIGFMGDTEPLPVGIREDVPTDATVTIDPDAVAPHIRITMVDLDGNPVDAFGPLIDALFRESCNVAIGQWSVPTNGSGHDAVVVETTDDDREIDSEWVITPSGQVTASGWAAMINPSEGCVFTPSTAYGPGGDGSDQGLIHWLEPIDVPTDVWVSLALRDDDGVPGGLLLPG